MFASERHLSFHRTADCERLVQLDAEPGAELGRIRESAPDARLRRAEDGGLFDAMGGL
jgi:hypothetical protein